MSIPAIIHKALYVFALLVAIVQFAMVMVALFSGIADIDNMLTLIKLHTNPFGGVNFDVSGIPGVPDLPSRTSGPTTPTGNGGTIPISPGQIYQISEAALNRAKHIHVGWCTAWAVISGLTLLYYLDALVVQYVRPNAWFVHTGGDIGFNAFFLIATIVIVAAGKVVSSDYAYVAFIFAIIQIVLCAIIIAFVAIYVGVEHNRSNASNSLRISFRTLTEDRGRRASNNSEEGLVRGSPASKMAMAEKPSIV